MRLFVALDLDDNEYFSKITEQIPRDIAKIKKTKSFHLTLKFLGEVPDDKIDDIKHTLKQVKFEPFSLTTDNIGFFPNENYIKVIWIGVNEKEKVNELQQKVEKALSGMFPKDKRFHPHITLARVKSVKDKKTLKDKLWDIKSDQKEFSISCFKLIKSTLTGDGPIYEVIEEFS